MMTKPDSGADSRSDLRTRVEAARERNADRLANTARRVRDDAKQIVREHPVAVIGSAIAIGAVLAAFLPRRNRKFIAAKSAALGASGGKVAIDLAMKAVTAMIAAGAASRDSIKAAGNSAMDSAHGMGQELERLAVEATDKAREIGENAATRGSNVASKVRDRVKKSI
ncbi:MAG: hypothetical protein R3E21_07430 [Caenibius sp.]